MTPYDVIIIGGGPAGLTAGLYAARAKMSVLLLEGSTTVSQITVTDMIENYPGVPDVTGFDLVNRFKEQAGRFGLETKTEAVQSLERSDSGEKPCWRVTTERGFYESLAVIVGTGAEWRHLGVPGEEEFLGRGVSYCATCDGPFYRDRDVVVVGGGDTAVQEAIFLTKFAKNVTIVHRRDRLRAAGILEDRAVANEKIAFAWNSVVEKIEGDTGVSGVRVRNVKEGSATRTIPAEGVFIFIGLVPLTDIVRGVANVDEHGYIITDSQMRTSEPGLFAAGDCIMKLFRQVVTACGDGATAAHAAELYVDALKGESYDAWDGTMKS